MNKKSFGATLVMIGSVAWFGGSMIESLRPINGIIGIPLVVVGAILYFAGRK